MQPALSEIALAAKIVTERERQGHTSATPERLAKAGLIDAVEVQADKVQRVVDAPLDRLWKAGQITRREFEAGEEYRNNAYLAAIDPAAGSVDWNRTSGSSSPRVPAVFSSQKLADARIRWRRFSQAIPDRSLVSTLLFLALVREHNLTEIGRQVFGKDDKGDAIAAAHAGFRVALSAAADHYGL